MTKLNSSSIRTDFGEHIGFIWSIAELLRGNYKQLEYGKVVLPFTVLRRLDCVLTPTKDAVQAQLETLPDNMDDTMHETALNHQTKVSSHFRSNAQVQPNSTR